MDEFQASSEAEAKRKAHNERMKHYMRGYRLRKKLASGAVIALEASVNTSVATEPQSSLVAPPDAQTVVHLGPHGYPAD